MCGICGIWGKSDLAAVEKMVAAMRHRGPDDHGIFSDDVITLGMTRLAILDLSPAAHQPMSNPQQTIWIVYNGEVYNFQSQRDHLQKLGYTFTSRSDTEVLLRLYEHYGDDFLLRLRGMFALALHDKRRGKGKERLILARDPLGIKPLLYTQKQNIIIFASELKAMLASGMVNPEIDPQGLRLLLTHGSVYQPSTILNGVKMLLPAHRLIIEGNSQRIEQYWHFELDRISGLHQSSYEEQVQAVAEVLQESVKLQMVSDVPLGAFLSGGVDSSLLVGLMARAAGKRIKTFSVGYADEGKTIDETDDAFRTAAFLGTDHTRVQVEGAEVRERIEHIAASLDQPSVDGVNSYFISLAAKQAVTVAISGTGGDELFAGYPWFLQMVNYEQGAAKVPLPKQWIQHLEIILKNPLFHRWISSKKIVQLESLLRAQNGFLAHYTNTYQLCGSVWTERLLAPDLRFAAGAGKPQSDDLSPCDELPYASAVERVTALCLRGYTQNQLLRDIDAASMAHSLEVRVPFLDVPLVDVSLSLPSTAKLGAAQPQKDPYRITYRESGGKKILIDAGIFLGVLQPSIADQPKRGFAMPFDSWLKGPLREVLEDALSAALVKRRGLLNPSEVKQIKDDFTKGKIGWPVPWTLMMLELWQRTVLEKGFHHEHT